MREEGLMATGRSLATQRASSRTAGCVSIGPRHRRPLVARDEFRDMIELERISARQQGRVALVVDVDFRDVAPRERRQRHQHLQAWTESMAGRSASAGWLGHDRGGVLVSGGSVSELMADVRALCAVLGQSAGVRCWLEDHTTEDGPMGEMPIRRMPELFARPPAAWKRGLDIVVSLSCLVVLAPLLLTAMAAVFVAGGGPIFFSQLRVGRGGKPFRMYKIRTMSRDAEARKAELLEYNELDGLAFKMQHDPRVTPIGHWLRKLSIDELPQLWNVLRGDMSIVGPRPLPVADWEPTRAGFCRRHDVNPGITCTWQVAGRCRVSFDAWMEMDLKYARRVTLLGDARLILQTLPAVLSQHGAA